jgi:hypothetical protein
MSAPSSDEQWLEDRLLAPHGRPSSALTAGWLVGCFTTRRDDLSQWRAHSGGEDWYAIGFSGPGLFVGGSATNNYLAPVNYDGDLHQDIARKIAGDTFRFFLQGVATRPGVDKEEWVKVFAVAWADATAWLAPIVKNPAFAAKEEYRLVRRPDRSDFSKMKYRQRRSMLTRHLPVTLAQPGSAHSLPITEIMVGPGRHQHASSIGVGDLLRMHGYGDNVVPVTLSRIPFQNT